MITARVPTKLFDNPFKGPNTRVLPVRIPETLYTALTTTAKKEKTTLPKLVRHALYFMYLPAVLERNLKVLRKKYRGMKALEMIRENRPVIDEAKMDLGRLQSAVEVISESESFILELGGILETLETMFNEIENQTRKEIERSPEPLDFSDLFKEINEAIIRKVGVEEFKRVKEAFGLKKNPKAGSVAALMEELADEIKKTG